MFDFKKLEDYAYFKKTHPNTHNKAVFLDGFENNIVDAINLNSSNETKQNMILGSNLNLDTIKDTLINNGIKPSNIKVITKIQDIPFSFQQKNTPYLTGLFYPLLKEKYSKSDIGRNMGLLYSAFEDVRNNKIEQTYINFKNLKNNYINTRKKLLEIYNTFSEDKVSDYSFIPTDFFESKSDIFDSLNKMLDLKKIDNNMDDNISYIFNIDSKEEIMVIAMILRHFTLNSIFFEYDGVTRKVKNKIGIFIEFKNFGIEGYIVSAAMERSGLILNLFLDENSYINGFYSNENLASMKVNLELCVAKTETTLLDYMKDD